MVIDPSAVFNAFICAAIVIVLMFYQRHGARHRPLFLSGVYNRAGLRRDPLAVHLRPLS